MFSSQIQEVKANARNQRCVRFPLIRASGLQLASSIFSELSSICCLSKRQWTYDLSLSVAGQKKKKERKKIIRACWYCVDNFNTVVFLQYITSNLTLFSNPYPLSRSTINESSNRNDALTRTLLLQIPKTHMNKFIRVLKYNNFANKPLYRQEISSSCYKRIIHQTMVKERKSWEPNSKWKRIWKKKEWKKIE